MGADDQQSSVVHTGIAQSLRFIVVCIYVRITYTQNNVSLFLDRDWTAVQDAECSTTYLSHLPILSYGGMRKCANVSILGFDLGFIQVRLRLIDE